MLSNHSQAWLCDTGYLRLLCYGISSLLTFRMKFTSCRFFFPQWNSFVSTGALLGAFKTEPAIICLSVCSSTCTHTWHIKVYWYTNKLSEHGCSRTWEQILYAGYWGWRQREIGEKKDYSGDGHSSITQRLDLLKMLKRILLTTQCQMTRVTDFFFSLTWLNHLIFLTLCNSVIKSKNPFPTFV